MRARRNYDGFIENMNPFNEEAQITATIENGESDTGIILLDYWGPRGFDIIVPSAWTAADIVFEVSIDGEAFVPLVDETGTRVRVEGIATGASQSYMVGSREGWSLGAYRAIKLVSVSVGTETPANQGADRDLTLVLLA